MRTSSGLGDAVVAGPRGGALPSVLPRSQRPGGRAGRVSRPSVGWARSHQREHAARGRANSEPHNRGRARCPCAARVPA
jgi:hypothetical protein